MKCPICGKNVEFRKKQVGVDEQGNPVFNQYAICKDCKKQWNLDKKRSQKTTEKKVTTKQDVPSTVETDVAPVKKAEEKPVTKPTVSKADSDVQTPVKKAAPAKQNPTKKPVRRPASKSVAPEADSNAQAPIKKAAPAKQDPTKKPVRRPASKPVAPKADSDAQAPIKKAAPAKQDPTKKPVRRPASKPVAPKADSDAQAPVKKVAPAKQDPTKKPVRRPASKPVAPKADVDTQSPVKKAAPAKQNPAKKAVRPDVASKETMTNKAVTKKFDDKTLTENNEQKLGNIPSEKVRSKKEQRVKQGYAEMLAADPKSTEHKNPKAKKQPAYEDTFEDDYNEYEPIVRFRALRVIFGIISILIAAFYAFNSYSSGLLASTSGVTFLILAGCMGVAGLLLIILNATNNIFAFLLPMILYLASGLYAFLNRGDDTFLLYSAIIGAAFSVLFIILAITSRGDEEDYDDFDDDEDDDDDDWDDNDDDNWDDDDDDDWNDDDDDDWDDDDDDDWNDDDDDDF